jgi:hypothetical protein
LQAQIAGNVVIVIPDFAECFEQALNINSDLNLILNNLIISNKANIIAIANKNKFSLIMFFIVN